MAAGSPGGGRGAPDGPAFEDAETISDLRLALATGPVEAALVGVTDEMLRRIAFDRYDLFILNYANGDMVGHTGVLRSAVMAVEAVDLPGLFPDLDTSVKAHKAFVPALQKYQDKLASAIFAGPSVSTRTNRCSASKPTGRSIICRTTPPA